MTPRIALLSAACCLLFASCGGSRHDPNEKYYLVTTNTKLPYWQTSATGLSRSARDLGVMAEMLGPDTYDVNAEREAFQKAIRQKASGILVSAADANALKPDIDSAIQQNIPVITIDSDSPSSSRVLFVGTNNYQAGLMGGRLAAKLLNGKGTALIYTMPGQQNLEERLHGYRDAFAEHPGIKIAQIIDIKGDPRIAFDTTSEILDKGTIKPDAFFCLEAIACKEISDVLTRKSIKGKTVIAMDTDKETLEWIQKGVIAATIAQKPYTMAYFGVTLLDDLHHRKNFKLEGSAQNSFSILPVFVDTGTTLIDKSNVGAFLQARDSAGS